MILFHSLDYFILTFLFLFFFQNYHHHLFVGVSAVIFVASISEFDQILFEDSTTNRMVSTYVRTCVRVCDRTYTCCIVHVFVQNWAFMFLLIIHSTYVFTHSFSPFSNSLFALVYILLPLSIFISISFVLPLFLLPSLPFSPSFLLIRSYLFSRSYISPPFYLHLFFSSS